MASPPRAAAVTAAPPTAAAPSAPPAPSAKPALPLDTTPPNAPAALTATARPGNEVELEWPAATDYMGVTGYEVFRDEALVEAVTTTSARDRVRATHRHCYAVRARDAAGNRSPFSPQACIITPDTTPPSAPTLVTGFAPSEREVVLNWAASTDDVEVIGYEVFRDKSPVARVGATTATQWGLEAATRYCYTVQALDAAGNRSEPSNMACVTTPDTTPPTGPGNLVAEAASDRAVDVKWTRSMDNVGVAGYELYRGETLVETTTALSTRDVGLRPAKRYCYTAVAFDAAGNRSEPGRPVCVETPDLTPPTMPESLVSAPKSATESVLAWMASTDDVAVTGYEVLRGGRVISQASRPQASDRGLAPLTDYCYQVRALDAAGNRSKPSEEVCIRTPDPRAPAGPTRLRADAVTTPELVFRWDPSPDPDVVYVVYWDGQKRGDRKIGVTPLNTFTVFGPVARDLHCYRVTAQNADGRESGKTSPVCARAGDAAQPPSLTLGASASASIR